MGVTEEHASPLPPARLFKATFTDAPNLMPNLMPQHVKKIEREGEGVGSISKTVFHEGSGLKNMKYRIDAFDSQNLMCKYTLIEGDILDHDNLESISYLVKFEPSSNGGSIVKTTAEYHSKGTEVKLLAHTKAGKANEAGKANAHAFYKVVGGHLHNNPRACA